MFDHSRHPLTSLFCIPTLLLVLNLPLAAAGPAPPPTSRFRFADGDRVVLIGNTLIERAQRFGHLESALVARLAPLKLTFRNLGWSGDTVFAESRGIFDTPAKGYQRLLEHVARLKPTVLILGYGSNESFDGPKGLAKFLRQYSKLIADLRARAAPSARVVILSIPPNSNRASVDSKPAGSKPVDSRCSSKGSPPPPHPRSPALNSTHPSPATGRSKNTTRPWPSSLKPTATRSWTSTPPSRASGTSNSADTGCSSPSRAGP